MTEQNYKCANIDRSKLEATIEHFIRENGYSLDSLGDCPGSQDGLRVVFGAPGIEFATVNIFYVKDGTTTLQFKTGKNHELGEELVKAIWQTAGYDDLKQVNMVLMGFTDDDLTPILQFVDEEEHFSVDCHEKSGTKVCWCIVSPRYQDTLTLTLHVASRKLQIQGRPLACYRTLIFYLAEVLDLAGLEKVLIRQDEQKSEFVHQEVARSNLQSAFGESYENLPGPLEKLLVSGLCVKLASPKLPDYSMLLYPELRSLEGALKQQMGVYGLHVTNSGFGEFFSKSSGEFKISSEYESQLPSKVAESFSRAYTFFNNERHGLFHMDEVIVSSRMISDITHVMTKSRQAWDHLKTLLSD